VSESNGKKAPPGLLIETSYGNPSDNLSPSLQLLTSITEVKPPSQVTNIATTVAALRLSEDSTDLSDFQFITTAPDIRGDRDGRLDRDDRFCPMRTSLITNRNSRRHITE
jgi:hypothetical protein